MAGSYGVSGTATSDGTGSAATIALNIYNAICVSPSTLFLVENGLGMFKSISLSCKHQLGLFVLISVIC